MHHAHPAARIRRESPVDAKQDPLVHRNRPFRSRFLPELLSEAPLAEIGGDEHAGIGNVEAPAHVQTSPSPSSRQAPSDVQVAGASRSQKEMSTGRDAPSKEIHISAQTSEPFVNERNEREMKAFDAVTPSYGNAKQTIACSPVCTWVRVRSTTLPLSVLPKLVHLEPSGGKEIHEGRRVLERVTEDRRAARRFGRKRTRRDGRETQAIPGSGLRWVDDLHGRTGPC